MKITNSILYIGVNDKKTDLFEGQYLIPSGISYNSYIIMDEKIAVMDTVDSQFTHKWLDNISEILNGKTPDYLIIQHMEPDHSANIDNFMKIYKDVKIVSSEKSFTMMKNFFGTDYKEKQIIVKEGDTLSLGNHTLSFIEAPMVHWPEVILTYDMYDKVLFSADAFGKFGTLDTNEPWEDEARRYYIGIVGKYGKQVQALLKKAKTLDIKKICPLHGPVLNENLEHYIFLYSIWSSYSQENDGIVIAYTSIYSHTKKAVELIAEKLRNKGCPRVEIFDLARCDIIQAVAKAFQYGKIVLATTTYNADIFPFMKTFIEYLKARNFSNRTVALVENGSWSPYASKTMRTLLEECKNITFTKNNVLIKSALSEENYAQIEEMCTELCFEYLAASGDKTDKNDKSILFNIEYGLYAITTNDKNKDNVIIVNAVTQITNTPDRIAVTINKDNYSCHIINQTGIMNVNILSVDAPFEVFERFGFQSGRNIDKLKGIDVKRSDNGLVFLPRYSNSFVSLKVEQSIDFDTHIMFICAVTESRKLSEKETMTYGYYYENVKPKPNTERKGYVCKVCGYVYEGETLPDDFICPLCKHGASDFIKIE